MINHNNEAVLIDFGVSAIFEQDDNLVLSMGTYKFFAPEIFTLRSDQNIKIRGSPTDLWAVGITLYFMVCG